MELVMRRKSTVAADRKGIGVALIFTGFVFEALAISGVVSGAAAAILITFPLLVFAGTLLALN